MSHYIKRNLVKTTLRAVQAGFLSIAILFAWQGEFWLMMQPLYYLAALIYLEQIKVFNVGLK